MTHFETILSKTLTEMATLGSWQSNIRELPYAIYYTMPNGSNVHVAKTVGESPNEAIENFLTKNDYSVRRNNFYEKYKITPDETEGRLWAQPSDNSEYGYNRFTANDKKSIQNPKVQKIVENWLNNNYLGHKWHFYFGSYRYDMPPDPDGIIFIKFGNAGLDVLTPHMIFHTVGHAICTFKDNIHLSEQIELVFKNFISGDRSGLMRPACQYLHMKAAYNTLKGDQRGFPNFSEMVNEMAGIMAKFGKVKIAPNKFCQNPIPAQAVDLMSRTINIMLERAIDNCVGHIITDD